MMLMMLYGRHDDAATTGSYDSCNLDKSVRMFVAVVVSDLIAVWMFSEVLSTFAKQTTTKSILFVQN